MKIDINGRKISGHGAVSPELIMDITIQQGNLLITGISDPECREHFILEHNQKVAPEVVYKDGELIIRSPKFRDSRVWRSRLSEALDKLSDFVKPEGLSDNSEAEYERAGNDTGVENQERKTPKYRLYLSHELCAELNLHLGAGKHKLEMDDLSPSSLRVNLGAGTLEVKADQPVRKVMDDLILKVGAGRINILNASNLPAKAMKFSNGAGKMSVDYSGKIISGAQGEIKCGVGQVNMNISRETAANIREASCGMGKIEITGLNKSDKAGGYVTESWDEKSSSLNFDLSVGMGNIVVSG